MREVLEKTVAADCTFVTLPKTNSSTEHINRSLDVRDIKISLKPRGNLNAVCHNTLSYV